MNKVTVQTAAIKGTISIVQSDVNPMLYLVASPKYKPMEISAADLASAVSEFFTRIGSLQYTDESIAKSKARSERAKADFASGKRKPPFGRTPADTKKPNLHSPSTKSA